MLRFFGRPQFMFAPDGVGSGAPSSSGTSDGGGGTSSPTPSTPAATPSPSPAGGSGAPAPSSPSGASPASTTPAATPAPTAPPVQPQIPSGADGNFDFAFGDEGGDDDTLPPMQPEVTPPQPTPPPQVVEPAPAEPAATATPAPASGPQATSPLPSPAEPQAIAEALVANEAEVLQHLAQNEFKLSNEDIEALETNAPEFIPTLLARMYYKSQVNMLQQMGRIVPAMVQQMRTVAEANTRNETKFYSRWPDLKPELHGPIVSRNAKLYRQMNPTASLDQMIEDLGPIVMMAAKLAPGMQHATNGQGGVTPPVPGARLVTAPSPFRPAGSGSSSAPPQPGGDQNPWSGLMPTNDEDE